MTTTINNEHKKLNFSSEREQSQACLNSAEHEKNQGRKVLNVPNLRFPEFQGEWEKCRLGDVCTFISGGTPKIDVKEYWNGTIPFVSAISMHDTYILDSKLHISEEGLKHGSRLLTKNNLLLLVRGSMLWNTIPICLNKNDVAFNQDVKGIIANDTINNEFLLYWLKSKEQRLKYMVTGTGLGAGKLDTSDLLSMIVYIPAMKEQDKVARLLSLFDERIAAQNKIIEDLKKLKCAIIEKHYLQAKLHKYKICDLGVPFSVGSLSKEDLSEKGHECILYGELFTTYDCVINEVKSHTNKIANTTLSQKGDLVFPSSTTVDAVSLISPSVIDIPNVILGGDMFGIHIDKKFNAYYLSYYINLIARKKLAIYAKGSTIIHLHYNDIANAQLLLPDLCEQDIIAKCMIAEDNKIKVEEQLLTKLENQKQYLLRQMFV